MWCGLADVLIDLNPPFVLYACNACGQFRMRTIVGLPDIQSLKASLVYDTRVHVFELVLVIVRLKKTNQFLVYSHMIIDLDQ